MNKNARPLRVLAISGLPLFPLVDKKGGVMGIYFGLKSFVDRGHVVHFLTCRPSVFYFYETFEKAKPWDYDEDGIQVHEFKFPFLTLIKRYLAIELAHNKILHYTQYAGRLLCQYLILIIFTLCAVRKSLKLARTLNPDVVYGFQIASVASWIVAKIRGIPHVNRQFGTFLYELLPTRWSRVRYFPAFITFTIPSDYLIVSNDGTKADLVAKMLKIPEHRFRFWRDGVDGSLRDLDLEVKDLKARLGLPPDTPIVLSLGRLEPVKGVHKLIRVIPKVLARTKDVLFLVVGEGTQTDELVALVRQLGVGPWVRFMGGVSREGVKAYLHVADIFVQLCDISNITNTMLEAMICSRCVVTIDDKTTSDMIIHKETGFLVPPGDEEALADVLVQLIQDPMRRRQVGEKLGERAGERLLTWDKRGQMEVDLVESLVRQRNTLS